jgi:hypothetical protein
VAVNNKSENQALIEIRGKMKNQDKKTQRLTTGWVDINTRIVINGRNP